MIILFVGLPYSCYFLIMKLQQGQVWVKGKDSYRITEWARMTIQYKHSHKAKFKESDVIEVSKKEFCRLIKGAVLEETED